MSLSASARKSQSLMSHDLWPSRSCSALLVATLNLSFFGELIFVVLGMQRELSGTVGYLRGLVVGQFVKISNVLFRHRPERNTNSARLEVCQFSMKLWLTPGSYLGNTMIQTVLEVGAAQYVTDLCLVHRHSSGSALISVSKNSSKPSCPMESMMTAPCSPSRCIRSRS